jgi:hypothetical protein
MAVEATYVDGCIHERHMTLPLVPKRMKREKCRCELLIGSRYHR